MEFVFKTVMVVVIGVGLYLVYAIIKIYRDINSRNKDKKDQSK